MLGMEPVDDYATRLPGAQPRRLVRRDEDLGSMLDALYSLPSKSAETSDPEDLVRLCNRIPREILDLLMKKQKKQMLSGGQTNAQDAVIEISKWVPELSDGVWRVELTLLETMLRLPSSM